MSNDSKYVRLYPERAVAPLRNKMRQLLNADGVRMQPHTRQACETVLADLEGLGFPPDEPLFLLRGQDELAPATVEFYFDRARGSGLPVDEAHVSEHIDAMLRWQPRKLPD